MPVSFSLFSPFLRLRSALYGALFFAFLPGMQAETSIALFGPESGQKELVTLLSDAGTVRAINAEELATIDSLVPDFLLIAPGAKVPPESRRSIHRYREQRGNLILLEPTAFLYRARSENAVSAVDFRNRESFSVRASAIADKEPEVGLTETQTPDGSSNAIRVSTRQMGDGDVLLEIPLEDVRSPERNMLRFQARGSHGTGILYLSIRDRGGRRSIHFVDLDLEWNDYEVRMADFVRMSRDADGSERLVPEEANLLEVGMVSRILWPERDAEFSIGEVALARGVGEATVRSGEVALWEDQYRARGAFFPDWLQDPFEGTSTFRAANGSDGIYWEIPKPPYKRGRSDAPASTKLNAGDDLRRVLAAVESVEGDRKVVAEGRWFNDGPFAGGSLVLFGAPGESYAKDSAWGKLLLETVRRIDRPMIVRVAPVLPKWRGEGTPMEMAVTVSNPGTTPVEAEVSVEIAEGIVRGRKRVELNPGDRTEVAVPLSEVPTDFNWENFTWKARLEVAGKEIDSLKDTVDLPETLLLAARHLVKVQNWHGDGRFSHHFFSDHYAARFLIGFVRWLEETGKAEELSLGPEELEEFRQSAFRFGDMIVRRQAADGSFPMGYMEHRNFVYVADLGQVALGLVQIASWLEEGDPRREAYLSTVRRYRDFRESFYMNPERVKKLEAEFGADPTRIREGFYGLGHFDFDFFNKERWGELRREERGPWWVLPVSMAFLGALAQIDEDPAVAENADRDIRFYLDAGFGIGHASYFHAESLFWMMEGVDDSQIRAEIAEKLEKELPLQLFKGVEYPYFEVQGRASLWPLSAVYARNMLGDSPTWRGPILAALVAVGSNISSNSMANLAALYPRTTYGPSLAVNRYVGFSALWILELLDEGNSLMKKENSQRR